MPVGHEWSDKDATDDPWYCGVVCLPEHRLVIVERDWRVGKIRLHDRNTGDLIAKSNELPGPWGVCVLDEIGTLLAVALECGNIQILSIQNIGPSVTIRSHKLLATELERCHGVSAIMSKKLVVSGRYQDMICWCVLSLDGMMDRIHRIIPISGTGDLDGRSYLATSEDLSRVYISCYSGLYSPDNGVYGYDVKSGDHKFTYRISNLSNPRGICVDSRGYIYVCNCWDPFCIHQLTEQGESMTVFKDDIPRWPRAICLDENKEEFLITRRESNEVLTFRLEWNEQNAFPEEILNMDERSLRIYKEALQDGKETVYNIRVMVVGQYGVGKTTLTKRLLGKDVNLSKRNSTEGIDVHINCCRVSLDTCEWMIEHKEDQQLRLQRLLKLLQEETQRIEASNKQEGHRKVISQKDAAHEVGVYVNVDNVHTDNEEKLNSLKPDIDKEFRSTSEPTENVSSNKEKKDPVLELLKMINENVDTLETNRAEFATLALWDYAGQYAFYTTHQTFLTKRAIYLLVTDLTQQVTDPVKDDEFFFDSEGIKLCNVHELIEVWLNSIHSCASSPEAGTPPVILVGTHLDQIPKDFRDEVTVECFKKIRLMLKDNPGRHHLTDEDFAIDNTQSDPRLEALKRKIVKLASSQSHWGEKVPARWLPLEQAIMMLKASGIKVVPLNIVEEINREGSVSIQTMEELDLFLRFHHETGTIIYFSVEGLRDKIVLEPQWLIDALKSLITAEMFILLNYPSIIDKWCVFRDQGKINHELIDAIWTEEKNQEFHRNKEHILLLMEKLNIVARARTFSEIGDEIKAEDYYIAPCMLRQKTPKNVIYPKLNSQMESTSVLCYVFMGHILPSPVFHRLLAACVAHWPISKKKSENLIYCGCCVFDLDLFHRLTLHFRDYVIFARITRMGISDKTPTFKLCLEVKNFITEVLTKIIGYLSQSLRFQLHIQCPESDVDSVDSLIPVSLLQENAEIPCHFHENSHIIRSTDQLKFWFEDKKPPVEDDDSSAISRQSTSDTGRFMRIVCLLIDVGCKVLRRLLQHHAVTPNCTLDQYLAKNKRDIYNLFKRKTLNQSQIDILFPPSRGKTNLDEYDITLLSVLFNSIVSTVNQQERDMIQCLRENRNKIYGHAKSSKINCQEYQSYWTSISSSLMNLCKQCKDIDFENETLLEIQRIQVSEIPAGSCLDILKTWFSKIETVECALQDLTSKVQELQSRKYDDSET